MVCFYYINKDVMPDNQECSTTNERIKHLRHSLKLTQEKFAKIIHISNGYQAELELGHCKVNERIIALIAAAFDVSEQWLKTGEGAMFTQPALPCQTAAERLERMTKVFNELYPEFQDYILNQIDQLIGLQDVRHN
jgi:transcriptional regulator with XRE-family HTH domain